MPTIPTVMPRITMLNERIADPRARTAAPVMPSTIREKYSMEVKVRANSATIGAQPARMTTPTMLPHSDAMVVMNSATPARPLCAIG